MSRRYAAHHPTWEVIEGQGGFPWRKAVAIADGISKASGDIFVIADADVWCDGLQDAVDALDTSPWVIPHRLVYRLNEAATNALYDFPQLDPSAIGTMPDMLEELAYIGWSGGGIVIIQRDAWDVAPMDPRFCGWGQEDVSWGFALDALVGDHERLHADLWHLWHAPQARLNRRTGSDAGHALAQRYRAARHKPDQMAALVAEGSTEWPRHASTSTSS